MATTNQIHRNFSALRNGWRLGGLLLWLTGSLFAAESRADGPEAALADHPKEIRTRIARGQDFLAGLFDPQLNLLPEFRGSKTYWLYHDNYLAARMLAKVNPELSRRIYTAMRQYGVTNSGKIEIVFNEAPQALPFRKYDLTDVATVSGKLIRTERVTTNILAGWEQYADLLLLAAIAQSQKSPGEARQNFNHATAMWDGKGFRDRVVQQNSIYATYKLALYLIAADRLKVSPPPTPLVLKQLLALQADDGGWRTDYNSAGPVGLTNVETTSLALLALETLKSARR